MARKRGGDEGLPTIMFVSERAKQSGASPFESVNFGLTDNVLPHG
jgi:hypothetical protein